MERKELIYKIDQLRRKKKAIILAHNYQRPEVQDIADYVGDSIELSQRAISERGARLIVFSAVDFMAESAAIMNPEKNVLLPSLGARCPMAQMLPVETLRLWKSKYPRIPIVLYVNTLVEAKAECDVCCTSANAAKVVGSLESDTVLFGPDHNLAWYVQQKTGKNIIAIPERGFCPTHALFAEGDILFLKEQHPNALALVHCECTPEVQLGADFVGSTSQMCSYAKKSTVKQFIVGTENGLMYRLKKENPDKKFIPAYEGAICPNMKINTLERIYLSLKEEKHLVRVPRSVAEKARFALEKMFELSNAS